MNFVLKTDSNGHFIVSISKTKPILILIFVVLVLFLLISGYISNEIHDAEIKNSLNDTSYLDEGYYETTINGVIFHIPIVIKKIIVILIQMQK